MDEAWQRVHISVCDQGELGWYNPNELMYVDEVRQRFPLRVAVGQKDTACLNLCDLDESRDIFYFPQLLVMIREGWLVCGK